MLLPLPEAPTSAARSRAPTENDTSRRTGVSPYDFHSPEAEQGHRRPRPVAWASMSATAGTDSSTSASAYGAAPP